jgi:hypothetical protein
MIRGGRRRSAAVRVKVANQSLVQDLVGALRDAGAKAYRVGDAVVIEPAEEDDCVAHARIEIRFFLNAWSAEAETTFEVVD